MKKTKLMKSAAILMASVMALSLSACSNESSAPASKAAETSSAGTEEKAEASAEGGKTFGITYWTESDFFKTIANSITEAAAADGNSTVIVNAEQDSAKQIQIVEDFITQGVDAVFLNPVDRDAITPALELLNEAGIPIINFILL